MYECLFPWFKFLPDNFFSKTPYKFIFVPMLKAIPHILTLSNLFFGCAAIICLITGNWDQAIIFIFISGIADFFDGMAARALSVSGELGKQLDSLADVVSFGFVPGIISYILISRSMGYSYSPINELNWAAMSGFILTLFSAIRLGKFNIDTRQSHGFIGLNTPTNTFFFCGLLWLVEGHAELINLIDNPYGWVIISVFMSLMMVVPLPMFSFKVKKLSIQGNEYRILLVLGIILLIIFFGKAALSLSVIYYILLSIIQFLLKKKQPVL
jgi:CDP-diacylglycerol--serine O-phosphatidyltransferase